MQHKMKSAALSLAARLDSWKDAGRGAPCGRQKEMCPPISDRLENTSGVPSALESLRIFSVPKTLGVQVVCTPWCHTAVRDVAVDGVLIMLQSSACSC